MNSISPKISLIIPVFNTATYLEECLKSITSQSYSNIEIIVINDGSTDNSKQICQRFADSDSRIRFIDKENEGLSETRNCGIEHSSGDYLMFVDSDDYIEQNAIERLVNATDGGSVDYVICGNYNLSTIKCSVRHIFNDDKYFKGEEYLSQILIPTLGPTQDKFRPEILDRLTPVWARLYKRSIVVSHNIRFITLNDIPSEALQFNFEFCFFANTAKYIDFPLYYYRRNTSTSVTKPFRRDLVRKWSYWNEYINNFLNKNNAAISLREAAKGRLVCALIPLGGNALKIKNPFERYCKFKEILNTPFIIEALDSLDTS